MNDNVKGVGMRSGDHRTNAIKMVESNPTIAAAVSKMVNGIHKPTHDASGKRQMQAPDFFHMADKVSRMSANITDNENLMEMLPDLELASQILVSSILSPKDMMDAHLSFYPPEGLLDTSACSAIIGTVQTHFTQVHNINRMLPRALREMVFVSGSFPVAVIPESSIDNLINGDLVPNLQDFKSSASDVFNQDGTIRSLGILGPAHSTTSAERTFGLNLESYFQETSTSSTDYKVNFAFEEYDNTSAIPPHANVNPTKLEKAQVDPFVTFTDNPQVLKVPQLTAKLSAYEVERRLSNVRNFGVATEAFKKSNKSNLTEQQVYGLISRRPSGKARNIGALTAAENLTRKTIGEPLILELPPESTIPIYSPGQPERHAGYFLIVDETGNPISRASNPRFNDQLVSQFTDPGNAQHRLIKQAHAAFVGQQCSSLEYIDYATRIYGDMIESEIVNRLRNGLYKGNVSVARNDEIYRLMMARTLRSQHTQMLFIPASMMTYFALDYNPDGTGKSIMDGLKTINAVRAVLMMARAYGSVRNSIGRTHVEIQLDEDDPDPARSREKAMNTFAQGRSSMLPIHLKRPLDIVSTLQQAGVEFSSTGSSKLPDMKVEVSETNSNVQLPDDEQDENLRRMSFMRFGLSPETVDNGFSGDFATTAIASNVLMSRRVRQIQEQFVPMVMNNIRQIIRATEYLYDSIRDIININFEKIKIDDDTRAELQVADNEELTRRRIVDYVTEVFIDEMQGSLPSPDMTTTENQLTAFTSWRDLFDEILDAHLTPDMFDTEVDGETLANELDRLKAIVRNYHIRKWCMENGVLTELTSLTATDADGKPKIDLVGEHTAFVKEIVKMFGGIIKNSSLLGKNLDIIKGAATNPDGEESSSTAVGDVSTGDEATPEADGGTGGDGGFGDGPPDFNM